MFPGVGSFLFVYRLYSGFRQTVLVAAEELEFFTLTHFALIHWIRSSNIICCHVPEQVAAQDEAEHEDEEANAQDDDVDFERQMEELLRRHPAVRVSVLQHKVTHAVWGEAGVSK